MSMESNCSICVEKLIQANQLLLADTLSKIGDSTNPDWCRVCANLFADTETVTLYEEAEFISVTD